MRKSARTTVPCLVGALAVLLLWSPAIFAQGKNGTTLAAYKTIDICELSPGVWKYSGEIAIWNEGAVATQGLTISDLIEQKVGNKWVPVASVVPTAPAGFTGEIPAGTTMLTAVIFKYEYVGAAVAGTVRNTATITITNHSGHLGTPWGPQPRATWYGPVLPCDSASGCTLTQGYWANPNHTWPLPYVRTDAFFSSGLTWDQVLNMPDGGNVYLKLAHQYIAAVLNQANGASAPQGIQQTLDLAYEWFLTHSYGSYPASSNGTQVDWAAILNEYNNGIYPGGPPHCD
jgi:hypothetical protein